MVLTFDWDESEALALKMSTHLLSRWMLLRIHGSSVIAMQVIKVIIGIG